MKECRNRMKSPQEAKGRIDSNSKQYGQHLTLMRGLNESGGDMAQIRSPRNTCFSRLRYDDADKY